MKQQKNLKEYRNMAIRIAVFLAAALALAVFHADRFIFQPPKARPPAAPAIKLEVAPGVAIALRYLPAPPGAPTLLYSHGNAEDLADLESLFQEYRARGYGVAAYDYEGYGESAGKPSEKSACRDIERVYRYLTAEAGVAPERIVIYGRSVGSGPSCYLAAKEKAKALILESPFTSAFGAVGLGWLPGDRFPNLKRMPEIAMPVLVFHGEQDSIIAPSHGRKLAGAARNGTFHAVPAAGHNDLLDHAGEAYWTILRDFIK